MNGPLIAKFLSFIMGIISLFMGGAALWGLALGDRVGGLAAAMTLGLAFAGLLYAAGRFQTDYRAAGIRDGLLVVSLSWVFASVIGALPFYISGMTPTFTDAFFEAMSGFTTTGASILTDIEAHPQSLLFWRSLTHWIGGMGIIVLSLAILPFIGVGGIHLLKAEVPGFGHEKMTPRLHQMALRLWGVYMGLTGVLALLYLGGGMSLFDALTHAFSSVATGGLSPKNASIGHFNSPFIEWVTTLFMFLSGVNFALHYRFLLGQPGVYRRDEEFRLYGAIVAVCSLVAGAVLLRGGYYPTLEEALRRGAFHVVSIITSTGYCTADYQLWPVFIHIMFVLLIFAGACTGSTCGGLKTLRVLILARMAGRGPASGLHPRGVFPVKVRGKAAGQDITSSVTSFFILYLAIFAAGALFMAALGLDFETAVTSAAAALGNTGPGFGSVGPASNYFHIPAAGKWALSILMLLGRLELYAVMLLFYPGTWRK
ncbi:MAG: TrkH family potassium uptake protein [Aminivibrio sp.]|jgi:trk system potassium uptake protein TrkH|nr:TrkH family potassium uptake protein [Synergistaceae bacterium]